MSLVGVTGALNQIIAQMVPHVAVGLNGQSQNVWDFIKKQTNKKQEKRKDVILVIKGLIKKCMCFRAEGDNGFYTKPHQ